LGLSRRLQDLREQVDIVLPEMTARIAALEHLLLEKHLCTRKDLIDARLFVRVQEA
jgi:Holliday junction resolvasome RuvABC endonuclease subunit